MHIYGPSLLRSFQRYGLIYVSPHKGQNHCVLCIWCLSCCPTATETTKLLGSFFHHSDVLAVRLPEPSHEAVICFCHQWNFSNSLLLVKLIEGTAASHQACRAPAATETVFSVTFTRLSRDSFYSGVQTLTRPLPNLTFVVAAETDDFIFILFDMKCVANIENNRKPGITTLYVWYKMKKSINNT